MLLWLTLISVRLEREPEKARFYAMVVAEGFGRWNGKEFEPADYWQKLYEQSKQKL